MCLKRKKNFETQVNKLAAAVMSLESQLMAVHFVTNNTANDGVVSGKALTSRNSQMYSYGFLY